MFTQALCMFFSTRGSNNHNALETRAIVILKPSGLKDKSCDRSLTERRGTSSTRWQSLPSRRVRYTCVTHTLLPRWQSLVIAGDRITDYMMFVLQSPITLL